MIDFGVVPPGTTLYIPFHAFDSNDPSASTTISGLATSDIEIYKDGSVTQRASDAGYTLLDTDGIDFDATTGINAFSINLADNTTAGFYSAGSQYWVVVASVTIDAATVNFIAATFRIGYTGAVLNTTIATLASQTSFTLTNGPAEDDALNGSICLIHDVASAVQLGYAVILDYTGASKTVTLAAGTTFTAAATDNISIFPPSNITHAASVAWASGAITAAVIATDAIDADAIADNAINAGSIAADAITAAKIATGAIDADAIADGAIDAGAIAAGAITSAKFAADAIDDTAIAASAETKIAQAVWDEPTAGNVTAGTFGEQCKTDIDAILVDTAEIGAAGAGLTAIDLPDQTMNITGNITGNLSGSVGSVTGNVGGNVAGSVGSVTAGVALTAAGIDAILDDGLADSVPADGALPTVRQALYMITQFLYERSVSGTTVTVRKVDGTTALLTLTLNDGTSPTSITRAT